MIVKLKEDLSMKEIEVLIQYASMNQTIKRLEALIQSVDKTVKCRTEDKELWINASDIFYIESIDKKTFVYCETTVFRTDLRLYQLINELSPAGFVQVSKSCLININVLESITPLFNSRMDAALQNGEHINVTRKYIPAIRAKLKDR